MDFVKLVVEDLIKEISEFKEENESLLNDIESLEEDVYSVERRLSSARLEIASLERNVQLDKHIEATRVNLIIGMNNLLIEKGPEGLVKFVQDQHKAYRSAHLRS